MKLRICFALLACLAVVLSSSALCVPAGTTQGSAVTSSSPISSPRGHACEGDCCSAASTSIEGGCCGCCDTNKQSPEKESRPCSGECPGCDCAAAIPALPSDAIKMHLMDAARVEPLHIHQISCRVIESFEDTLQRAPPLTVGSRAPPVIELQDGLSGVAVAVPAIASCRAPHSFPGHPLPTLFVPPPDFASPSPFRDHPDLFFTHSRNRIRAECPVFSRKEVHAPYRLQRTAQ